MKQRLANRVVRVNESVWMRTLANPSPAAPNNSANNGCGGVVGTRERAEAGSNPARIHSEPAVDPVSARERGGDREIVSTRRVAASHPPSPDPLRCRIGECNTPAANTCLTHGGRWSTPDSRCDKVREEAFQKAFAEHTGQALGWVLDGMDRPERIQEDVG